MFNDLTIAAPSIHINGTYTATGPTQSKIVPFSVEYQPISSLTQDGLTYIKGGAGFGSGYIFLPQRFLKVTYQAVNATIFDEDVDSQHFKLIAGQFDVRLMTGINVPEPLSVVIAMCAAVPMLALRRRASRA
jgi:hypothetical protein